MKKLASKERNAFLTIPFSPELMRRITYEGRIYWWDYNPITCNLSIIANEKIKTVVYWHMEYGSFYRPAERTQVKWALRWVYGNIPSGKRGEKIKEWRKRWRNLLKEK